jgi:Gram-negative porin
MKFDIKPAVAASALMLVASHASASTALGDYFTFSGFGTLGYVQTDSTEAPYTIDREGGGATTHANLNVNSDLGLQLTAQPTRWLSGTVQLLTEERDQPNLSTEVEWAFVRVQPLDGLAIRAGRMALPMFMISDTRYVGYANNWVSPPDEVYGLALLDRMEGGDVSYRLPIKSTSVTVSVLDGKSFFYGPFGKVDVKDVKGANVQWEGDWMTLRAGRVKGVVELGNTQDNYTFSDIGAIIDHRNIVAQAEYVTRRSEVNPSLVNVNGWYVLGGYRLNQVLPYVRYGSTKPTETSPSHLSGEQSTIAAGVRWDAFKSAAIKLQLAHVDTHDTVGVSFITPTILGPVGPPISPPVTKPVDVVSITIDFVF